MSEQQRSNVSSISSPAAAEPDRFRLLPTELRRIIIEFALEGHACKMDRRLIQGPCTGAIATHISWRRAAIPEVHITSDFRHTRTFIAMASLNHSYRNEMTGITNLLPPPSTTLSSTMCDYGDTWRCVAAACTTLNGMRLLVVDGQPLMSSECSPQRPGTVNTVTASLIEVIKAWRAEVIKA